MNTDRFKFRVWVRDSKEYYDGFVLDPDGVLWYAEMGLSDDEIMDKELYVVEQCTGLTDANGKLIYEGDIICGEYIIPSDVKRDDYGFLLDFAISCNKYATLRAAIEQGVAIIGNIHENPELLEAQNEIR